MTESNLIYDGVLLMLIGMGTVYLFLTLLVFLTSLLYRFIGDEIPRSPARSPIKKNDDEIAAISAAVHAYRSGNSSNKDRS